jgi:uncharacterized protein involved in response to NO
VAAACSAGRRRGTLLIEIRAVLWVASFLLFAVSYGPMLVSPRIDEGPRLA